MSDLSRILGRLVEEGLRGPVHRPEPSKNFTPAAVDKRNSAQYDAVEQDPDWNDPRWQRLFEEFFVSEHLDDWHDDLLFFVQRGEVENGGKGADPVFVKRKVKGHKRILTFEQEQVVLWKDTFFLNVIVQLHCKLTVAVCTRVAETHPLTGVARTSMACTRKYVSKRVYASPTKSRMDVKEESVECSWPIIYYVIDDFEDMFEHLMVHDQEYLCVELAVTMPDDHLSDSALGSITSRETSEPNSPTSPVRGTNDTTATRPNSRSQYSYNHGIPSQSNHAHSDSGLQAGKPFLSGSTRSFGIGSGGASSGKITLFQGAAGFQSLSSIYQQKAIAKVAKRFKLGPRKIPQEFVMMRGPGGRGHAQVAITASDRLDDPMVGLTSASDTHLGRYQQPTTVSTSPPLSNASHYSHRIAQQHPNGEKSLPPPPDHHYQQQRASIDSNGRSHISSSPSATAPSLPLTSSAHAQQQQRWTNGHHQAKTVRPQSNKSHHPPVSSSSSFFTSGHGNDHGHPGGGDVSGTVKLPPKQSSPARSFSAGSFFNSLRKLSLATIAHATGHGSLSPSSPPTEPQPQEQQQLSPPQQVPNGTRPRLYFFPHANTSGGGGGGGPGVDDDTEASSVRSGISIQGTGSRQDIEALVRDPKSLKCCMTFVNVPWTAIATTLVDFAYQQYPSARQQRQ